VLVKQGEIWLIALNQTGGDKARKTCPCIIISPPEIHDYLRTAITASITTRGSPVPFRPEITFEGKQGRIVLDQLRAVDKDQLIRKLGKCNPNTLQSCLETLQNMFAP